MRGVTVYSGKLQYVWSFGVLLQCGIKARNCHDNASHDNRKHHN
jgi:hypothetical protein